jgi:plasmid stabilization system protein ParE
MYSLKVTRTAERDLEAAFSWWYEHRSTTQAYRWFEGISNAILSLPQDADSHPEALEESVLNLGLREMHFGLGGRASHRVVFAIVGQTVTVYRVRHAAQRPLNEHEIGL